MEFEYDEAKSRVNKSKHGIDFKEAEALWLDDQRVEVEARMETERRFVVIGVLEGKHWTAVITYRSERIRISSARRSRIEEVGIYEG